MHSSWVRTAICLVTPLVLAAGCSQENWGYLEGVVRLNGSPVGPGTISLEPIDQSRGGAIARFGEDGKYSLISSGRKPGAPTGEYRVTIQGGENLNAETGGPPPETKIPRRYGTPAGSGLTVQIKSGDNSKDFDLQP